MSSYVSAFHLYFPKLIPPRTGYRAPGVNVTLNAVDQALDAFPADSQRYLTRTNFGFCSHSFDNFSVTTVLRAGAKLE